MAKPTVLVTGATGKTGAAVVAQLRDQGWPVRAMVRARDARSEGLGSEGLERQGAEIVVADIFDPDQLLDAMRGTRRAYYVPPIHPYAIHGADERWRREHGLMMAKQPPVEPRDRMMVVSSDISNRNEVSWAT